MTCKEATLDRVLCIQYPIRFSRQDQDEGKDVWALIDLGSKVNAMHPAYDMKLGLRARKIDVGVQKINGSCLNTFSMVISGVQEQARRVRSSTRAPCWLTLAWKWSWGCLSTPSPGRTYGLRSGSGAYLEDRHSCRGPANNSPGKNHRQEGIRDLGGDDETLWCM